MIGSKNIEAINVHVLTYTLKNTRSATSKQHNFHVILGPASLELELTRISYRVK